MRCETTHLQIISPADTDIRVQTYYVSVPKGISVLSVQPGWNVDLPSGVKANNIPANAFFFSRSNNDREFQLLKEKLDLITSNIAENQSVISSQLSALAADVADIKATGAKSSEVSAIISRLDNLSGNGDSVTLSQFNELSGQVSELSGQLSEARAILETKKSKTVFQNETEILTGDTEIIDGVEYPVYLKRFYFPTLGTTSTIIKNIDFPINTRIVDYSGFQREKITAQVTNPNCYKMPCGWGSGQSIDSGIGLKVSLTRITISQDPTVNTNRDTFVSIWYCKL